MVEATIARMGKKRSQKKAGGEDPGANHRAGDRHASPFMIRLPDVYREQLRQYQDKHQEEHRFRPPMTDVVKQAIEDFLAAAGLWPPEGKEGGGG